MSDEAVHRPDTLARVADSLRRIHDGPAIPGLFVPLRIVEAYRALAIARGVPIPPEYELASAIGRRIELALLAAPDRARGRATTTCSTRTSSTTARGSGSSTGSTPAWATRSSISATSASTTS